MLIQICFQITHIQDRRISFRLTDTFRIDIEKGSADKSPFLGRCMVGKRTPKMTGAKDDHIIGLVDAKDLSKLIFQITDIVSISVLAKTSKNDSGPDGSVKL